MFLFPNNALKLNTLHCLPWLAIETGAVKYPLVGWFDSRGILPLLDDAEPAAVGMNAFKWAEQHIHKVDVDEYWHFGAGKWTKLAHLGLGCSLFVMFVLRSHRMAADGVTIQPFSERTKIDTLTFPSETC